MSLLPDPFPLNPQKVSALCPLTMSQVCADLKAEHCLFVREHCWDRQEWTSSHIKTARREEKENEWKNKSSLFSIRCTYSMILSADPYLLRCQKLHPASNLIGEYYQIADGKFNIGVVCRSFPSRLVNISFSSQKLREVSMRRELHDNKQPISLCTSSQKVHNIRVFSNVDQDLQLWSKVFVLCYRGSP